MHLRMTPVAKLSQNKNIKELEAKLKKESGALLMDYVWAQYTHVVFECSSPSSCVVHAKPFIGKQSKLEDHWQRDMGWFCYRFHRHCVGLSSEQVSNLDKYICPTCAPDNSKKSNGPLQKTPEAKVNLVLSNLFGIQVSSACYGSCRYCHCRSSQGSQISVFQVCCEGSWLFLLEAWSCEGLRLYGLLETVKLNYVWKLDTLHVLHCW